MNAVDAFLAAVTAATIPAAGCWAVDATLDATVPQWRTRLRGPQRIRSLFSGWYADPGEFEECRRTRLPDGELVEFLRTWVQHGVPHAAHQAHAARADCGFIAWQPRQVAVPSSGQQHGADGPYAAPVVAGLPI